LSSSCITISFSAQILLQAGLITHLPVSQKALVQSEIGLTSPILHSGGLVVVAGVGVVVGTGVVGGATVVVGCIVAIHLQQLR
jgi:hypothetical protein